jgi:elongation factor Ts
MIKELRQATGAGVLDCKRALEASDGDFARAADYLREKGIAVAAKRTGRAANDGIIEAYVHHSSRIAAMVELNCETDFVARTEEFQALAHDLAMQVAATEPQYVTRSDVPPEVIEAEKRIYRAQMAGQNKPEQILDRIIEGKLEKFYQDTCILEQPFVKDEDLTIEELIKNAIAKTGENIVLRRFVRYEIGK